MKKLKYLLLMLIIVVPFKVNAEVKTMERTPENNYGVSKKWKITDNNRANVDQTYYVDATEHVYDFAEILTDEEEEQLASKIDDFLSKYKTEIVILTINQAYTFSQCDAMHDTIASDFYDYNDFGLDFEHYDGIVLLRNAYDVDPYFNMYAFGNAQLYFDQDRYDEVLDYIYSDIKAQEYINGMNSFIYKCSDIMDRGYAYSYRHAYIDDMGFIHRKYVPPYVGIVLVSVIITSIYYSANKSKHKTIKKETKADPYLDVASVKYSVRQDILTNSVTTHYVISSSSGSGGGGGGSHSGSSGGGHSSGGGRHG